MSIIVKKKPRYNKKKMMQRIAVLILIYFASFFSLYAFFGSKDVFAPTEKQKAVYKNDGEKFLANADYSKALEFYLKAVDTNPDDYDALTNLSIAYKNLGQFDKAKFYVFKSKELVPNYVENFVQIADIYLKEEKFNIAETAIDKIPATTAQNFLKKAELLVALADAEPDMEEKIIHYERALMYLKKYDDDEYKLKSKNLIELLFKQADVYAQKKDVENVKVIYKKILVYGDTCSVNNELAIKYQNISDNDVIKRIIQAVKKAESQEERRLTKKNLIVLKYYFEKKSDDDNVKLMNGLLDLLDGKVIIIDEKYTPYSVQNDSLKIVPAGSDKFVPQLVFEIKNKSEKGTTRVYAKADIYITHNHILDSKVLRVVNIDSLLLSNEQSSKQTIKLDTQFPLEKAEQYTVTLSLSEDAKNWQLYKIYKIDKKQNK